MALRTVAEDGDGVILEGLEELGLRVVVAFVNDLLGTAKVESFEGACLGGRQLVNIHKSAEG